MDSTSSGYFMVLVDAMQSSLVHMFGDPAYAVDNARFLADNATDRSTIDTIDNGASYINDIIVDEKFCWIKEEVCLDNTDITGADNCWNDCLALYDANGNTTISVTKMTTDDTIHDTNMTIVATDSNIIGRFSNITSNEIFGADNKIYSFDDDVINCWKNCSSPNISTVSNVDEWNPQNLSDGEILKQAIVVYGPIFIVSVIIFCLVRKWYPRAYNLRSGWISEDVMKSNSMAQNPNSTGWVSWVWKIWLISDTELSDECGMDALCVSRLFEWGVRITFFGSLVGCIVLMPIYATAGGEHDGERGIEQLNTSNVPSGSDMRFVATVISAYVIFGFVMYTALEEFDWFYKFRHQFLSRPLPRNYVVYVRNLAKEHQTKKSLIEYFSYFEDPSIEMNPTKAWVALKVPRLSQLVEKRASLVSKLEHNININVVSGRYPKTRCERTGHMITLVDAMFAELKELNREIKASIEKVEARARLENPHDYHAEDYQNPYQVDGSEAFFTGGHEIERNSNLFFDTIPSEPSIDDTLADKAAKIHKSAKTSQGVPGSNVDELVQIEEGDELIHTEKANGIVSYSDDVTTNIDHEAKPQSSNPFKAVNKLAEVAIDSLSLVGNKVEEVGKKAGDAAITAGKVVGTAAITVVGQATHVVGETIGVLESKEDDGAPMTAGFVAFSTLKACQAAKQMIHSNEVFGMEVLEGPGANDIYWQNVGKTHKELQMGFLLSFALTVTLCFFWTFIMTFISALSSVEGLVVVPFIADWLEKAPWLEMVLAQISPLLLIIFDILLKVLLEFLSGLEGPVSGMEVEALLFTKFSAFKIIQTFFVNAISGSVISQLSKIIKDPSTAITLLADALPNRSAFFIQILLVNTFVPLSMELLRVSEVATAMIRSFVGPKLTEDERRTTWMELRPLADPYEFRQAETLGDSVLYFVVFFVYAVLAPITSVFMFICFFIMGSVYRNQFIFIYPTLPDGGGKIWIQFMKIVPACLLIAEATISGFLALKSAPIASALMFPLIGITILFNLYIRQKHFKAADFLPGCRCVEADRKNNIDGPMDLRFISDLYVQPELRDKELYPKNASLELQLKHGMITQPNMI